MVAMCVLWGAVAADLGGAGERPEMATSCRLLSLGESIEFTLRLPLGVEGGPLQVFPRYLERADPGDDWQTDAGLAWLDDLASERLEPTFADGQAVVRYRPSEPGNYMARWQAGGETFCRHFAAIEDDWVVLRFSTFGGLESEPTLHSTGIPLDYRLPVERFDPEDVLFGKFLEYHRHYGDTIIPAYPDTPDLTPEQRLVRYRPLQERVRALLPDPNDARSARVEAMHEGAPGYTETLRQMGVVDHCGLWEANAPPWLGMPEFPYYASPADHRRVAQGPGPTVVTHQWDFCGGWHFIGPVSWHYKVSEGDWAQAERCITQGVDELRGLAEMSGHPAFAVPLYDGLVGPGYPNPSFQYHVPDPRPFRGVVDDVFVVGRALEPEEVRRAMDQGVAALPDALGAWAFNEGSGVAVGGSPGGTVQGEAQWVTGKHGSALQLDGGAHAVMAQPVAVAGADFTLGLWVRPERRQATYANLLSSHNDRGGRDCRGISLEQDGDHANRFYLIGGTATGWAGTDTTTQLEPDVWQHFAVVRRGTELVHYLNGEPVARGTVPPEPFRPATDAFRIGDWARGGLGTDDAMLAFVTRYQRLMAFEIPKRRKVAYARSVDIADYYRRHYRVTPRTVFVSKTDHVLYDRWWLCEWGNSGILVPRERIPWDTRVASILAQRGTVWKFKDPLSTEFMLVEDTRHSIRFERESPNPIWWFDYRDGPPGTETIGLSTRTPEVEVLRSAWRHEGGRMSITLRMVTEAEFPGYAIALWGLPEHFDPKAPIATSADEHTLAWNADGEYHLVLFFDLRPGAEVRVEVGLR